GADSDLQCAPRRFHLRHFRRDGKHDPDRLDPDLDRHFERHAISEGSGSAVRPLAIEPGGSMRRIGRLILALLRELSDENAYRRYLATEGRTHSGAEWRKFSEQRFRAKYIRAKRC